MSRFENIPISSKNYPVALPAKNASLTLPVRKHNARHARQYRCIEENCPRSSIGFATINDLYRHEKSVHGKHVGKSRMYKCFAPGCAKASKLWPRLDNFKQHLIRMHPMEDIDALCKK